MPGILSILLQLSRVHDRVAGQHVPGRVGQEDDVVKIPIGDLVLNDITERTGKVVGGATTGRLQAEPTPAILLPDVGSDRVFARKSRQYTGFVR